ncbi:VIT1/CCC1 transporter family protein [Chitinivorax sp. B]|uniref:VIT1/CCC1 transporter family protein n=1 Tax=Chitinivorax sp. B TaxID=2502235 RepID=UPI0010F84E17|nr:VIT1/CCC1 transporter family protein [Chitinivorax sp. B]
MLGPWHLRWWLQQQGVAGLAVFCPPKGWYGKYWISGGQRGAVAVMCVVAGGVAAGLPVAGVFLMALVGLMLGVSWQGLSGYIDGRLTWLDRQAEQAFRHDDPAQYPPEGAATLELIALSRGLAPTVAAKLAEMIRHYPDQALDAVTRELLCLDEMPLISPMAATWRGMAGFVMGYVPSMVLLGLGNHMGWVLSAYVVPCAGLLAMIWLQRGESLAMSKVVGGAIVVSGLLFVLIWLLRHLL